MSKDPAFLFYPGDYLRDTQTLSEKTQVAYDRIICEHMRNICISQRQLKFFTKRLSEDEIEELMFVLTKKGDGFQVQWVAESIEKRRAYSESRRKNRKRKNKSHMLNISNTYDEHMENEIENEIEYKNIKIKKIEKEKLIKKYGLDAYQWMIHKLSNYKLSSGKRYKSDYGAINSWVVKEWKKENIEEPKIGRQTASTIEQNIKGWD